MITKIKNFLSKTGFSETALEPEKAYDLWSANYDNQPGNLMLDLDEIIFSDLIKSVDLENKVIADIGCGTGRHWQKIFAENPSRLIGFDISDAMLIRLKRKFPDAETYKIAGNFLTAVLDSSVDLVISTLTIAHIEHIEDALTSWARILRYNGDLIITDFHPSIIANGGKRSFNHEGRSLSVRNYPHGIQKLKDILKDAGFILVREEERRVDAQVRSYYETKNAIPVYNRFLGMPVIFGLHLRKLRAS